MQTEQETVLGDTIDEQYRMKTTGRVIRPFKQLASQILQRRNGPAEYRLHLTSDGITVRSVDPSMVIALETTLDVGAFEEYHIQDETQIGVSSDILGSVFNHARYGVSTDDEITVTGSADAMQSTVTRDLHGVETTFTERQALIDSDSIRERPDMGNVPDAGAECTIPTRAFIDLVDAVEHDYLKLSTSDGLTVSSEGDISSSEFSVDIDVTGEVESTMYATDYVERISKALHVGKVGDEITLRFDDDFPVFVEFDREGLYSGEIMLAPRVPSDQ